MPRAKKENPRAAHRPQKPIDWALVDKFLSSGCPGTEIAGAFLMHPNTFYARFEMEYGVSFSEYWTIADDGGKAFLRLRQYTSAMQGNTRMLDKLGDERLGQGRKGNDLPPNESDLKDIHAALKNDLHPIDPPLKGLDDSLKQDQNATESQANPIIPASEQTI